MGFSDKLKEFIYTTDQEDEEQQLELTKDEAEAISSYEKPNLEGSSSITANTNIVLFEPRSFEEVEEIAYHIKSKRACCINLHRMPTEYRQRMIDFLSGVVFGVDGTIKKVAENVILCSPKNLTVAGSINLNEEY